MDVSVADSNMIVSRDHLDKQASTVDDENKMPVITQGTGEIAR